MKKYLPFLSALVLILATGITALVMPKNSPTQEWIPKTTPEWRQTNDLGNALPPQDEANAAPAVVITGRDAFGNFATLTSTPGMKDYTQNFTREKIKVAWFKGAIPLTKKEKEKIEQIFQRRFDAACAENGKAMECGEKIAEQIFLFKAGAIEAPAALRGTTLYHTFFFYQGLGAGWVEQLAFLDKNSDTFIGILPSPPQYDYFGDTFFGYEGATRNNIFSGFIFQIFDELTAPGSIDIPFQESRLIAQGVYTGSEDSFHQNNSGAGGIIEEENGELNIVPPFQESEIVWKTREEWGPVYFRDNAYNIVLKDGTVVQYELQPYFLSPQTPPEAEKNFYPGSFTAALTWNDGEKNTHPYRASGELVSFGCGGKEVAPLTNIVNDVEWFDEKNLTKIGATNRGEPVFELADKATNPFYDALFRWGYPGFKITNIDYSDYEKLGKAMEALDAVPEEEKKKDFLGLRPLFFWKDFAGHWRVYQRNDLHQVNMAECGKPVIYLYPEQETDVRVEVRPNGGFTKTEPNYPKDGWLVRAKPNGELYNYEDKKTYSYLFWEGRGQGETKFDGGFVLAREEVRTGMEKILGALGLNQKETADFLEFWEPKLTVKPFVLVRFMRQKDFDRIAPLRVTPKPDSVIRVFMDYEPLETPVAVSAPPITAPTRNSFTVIEWGGALHK